MKAKAKYARERLKVKSPGLRVIFEPEELKDLFTLSGYQRFTDYVNSILLRIGETPRERLEWAVRMVQKNPRTMMPGDWSNARQEIAVFVAVQPDGRIDCDKRIDVPSDAETRATLRAFGDAIKKVVLREPVPLASFTSKVELHWFPAHQRFIERERTETKWLTRAMRALGRLILDHGHLIKECPALAPRGKEGDKCGRWFVATRPRQEYCSTRCQTRASTRASREDTDTAATARRKREGRRWAS